ncbi:CLUMA_CG013507, isoform A [Clunio marinus]|uniref:CLUMA_CG013507, isoform A n=1 Tax=Clunio marinus TaxID=568069 RepID=A0A1J1IKE6_9DIPT|nr:CLUMA_CG013507, isoform A [Clunio marinus]
MIMLKICVIFLIAFLTQISVIWAESCFAKIDHEGNCSQLMANDVTKEDCCTNLGVGYGEEVSSAAVFMLLGGMKKKACKPCRETCDNIICGIGKRCIMKKGFPKCVCAPNCKATAAANKLKNVQNNKKISVIHLAERKNLKRSKKRKMQPEMQNDEPILIVATLNRKQNKRMNQRINREKNNLNETLILQPIKSAYHKVHTIQKNANNISQGVEDVDVLQTKIRSGYFDDDSTKLMRDIGNLNIKQQKFSHYNPICGSDSKTYKNECQLRKRACRQENKMLDVAYKGHCQSSCQFIKCTNGRTCIEDHNSIPQCITCPSCINNNKNLTYQTIGKMVCGNDGITYRSLCELKQKSCRLGKSIQLLHRGPCKEVATCSHCLKNQKCLPDLMNHQPKCVICNYKCPRKRRSETLGALIINRKRHTCFINKKTAAYILFLIYLH